LGVVAGSRKPFLASPLLGVSRSVVHRYLCAGGRANSHKYPQYLGSCCYRRIWPNCNTVLWPLTPLLLSLTFAMLLRAHGPSAAPLWPLLAPVVTLARTAQARIRTQRPPSCGFPRPMRNFCRARHDPVFSGASRCGSSGDAICHSGGDGRDRHPVSATAVGAAATCRVDRGCSAKVLLQCIQCRTGRRCTATSFFSAVTDSVASAVVPRSSPSTPPFPLLLVS